MSNVDIARIGSLAICIVGIVGLVMGALHMHECPFDNMIPIWLIVFGSCVLVRLPVLICTLCSFEVGPLIACGFCIVILLTLFDLGWVIYGSILVFGKKPEFEIRNSTSYCDKNAFGFTEVSVCLYWLMNLLGCYTSYSDGRGQYETL